MPQLRGPDELYGELFELVQKRHLFSDSKTFVDATPRTDVATILSAFADVDHDNSDEIMSFVCDHFSLPADSDAPAELAEIPAIRDRIAQLWDILSRAPDHVDPNSSLIELPRPYIIPGGRFREIYYWDSYFTMLGLAESGRIDAIEDMVENFAYLIDQIGFIPNGNRTYFCTRSQPPFFVLMVELLAEAREDETILYKYSPQLQSEYDFWMTGADSLRERGDATQRVVKVGDGFLNRYWDDSDKPRQESFAEDYEHAANSGRDKHDYYRNIRAACESGWDFSSRWLDESERLRSIRTTEILPVDLNALLYQLELCLAKCYAEFNPELADRFTSRAAYRKRQLQTLFFDDDEGFFFDLNINNLQRSPVRSLAAAYPLFLNIASSDQATRVVARIQSELLAPGGWVTNLNSSGQQWDRPNGWAPLQWIVFQGFCNYGFVAEAELGASRWVADNIDIYKRTGRLLEKYDVEHTDALATGGEYAVQDGFGWTNGVLLRLMNHLGL